jgi:thioredoxin-related protein
MVFLFVNQQEDAQTVDNFLTSQSLKLRNLLFDDSGELAKQVGSAALPTTLFYDAEGRQIGNHLGELSKASLARYLEAIGPEKAP